MRERKECLNEKQMILEKEERKILIEKQKNKRNGGKHVKEFGGKKKRSRTTDRNRVADNRNFIII